MHSLKLALRFAVVTALAAALGYVSLGSRNSESPPGGTGMVGSPESVAIAAPPKHRHPPSERSGRRLVAPPTSHSVVRYTPAAAPVSRPAPSEKLKAPTRPKPKPNPEPTATVAAPAPQTPVSPSAPAPTVVAAPAPTRTVAGTQGGVTSPPPETSTGSPSGGSGDDGGGEHSGGDDSRLGFGYGDSNHDHTGPPGQDSHGGDSHSGDSHGKSG
jgi:hypothetical protein